MKKIFYILSLLSISLFSCEKEEELEMRKFAHHDLVNINTALNQGTKKYNDLIQKLFDEHGSVLSYEFPEGTLSYTGYYSSINLLYHTPAKEEYVGNIVQLYLNLAECCGETWEELNYPRNILVVDSIRKLSSKTMLWLYSENLPMILGGAGDKTSEIFLADKPKSSVELKNMTATVSNKRARVVYRNKLFWELYNDRHDLGVINPPNEFTEWIDNLVIDPEVFNSFTGSNYAIGGKQTQYLRSLGLATLSSSSYNKFTTYFSVKRNSVTNKVIIPIVLLSGTILSDEFKNQLIHEEFYNYSGDLFKYGTDLCKVGTRMTDDYFDHPKMIEIIDIILDNSLEFADMDLKKLLSEEVLRIDSDKI